MERYWVRAARRLARRVSVGWWLHAALPLFIAVGAAGSALILIARRSGGSLEIIALALGIAASAAAVGAFIRARRRFFSERDALAWLDLTLGLHNRLSSASEGVGPWPPPQPITGFRWRGSALLPAVIPAVLLVAALLIPMTGSHDLERAPQSEPLAWTEVEDAVDRLAEEDSPVDQAAVEEWRERLEELRRRPEQEWFEHSSLEAGDHLRDQLDGALSELELDLMRARESLEQEQQDERAWKEALSDLSLGKLRLDPELAKQLAKIDPKDARAMTAEELAALKKALAAGVKQVRLAQGEPAQGEKGEAVLLLAASGGLDRGRGDADLTFAPEPSDATTNDAHNLATKDRTNASLGDLVGLSSKDHEIDPSQYSGEARHGGALHGRGRGGETVWKTSLIPDEQEFLERYFR